MMSNLFSFFYRQKPPRVEKSSGLLLVSSGGLGDTILFSIVLNRFAKNTVSGENITLLLRSESSKLDFLFGNNIVVEYIDYDLFSIDRSYRNHVCRYFYNKNFRMIINTDFLRHPKKEEVIIQASQSDMVIGMIPRPWKKYDLKLKKNLVLYNKLYDSGPIILDKVVRWNNFANWINDEVAPPPKIKLSGDWLQSLPTPEQVTPTIIFSPFSAVPEKQVSPEIFELVAKKIPDFYNIVVVGGPGDLDKNPRHRTLLQLQNVSFNDWGFEQLIPVIQRASLVLSVDTATMHLAVGLGVKTLCLASAAYVGEIVPYHDTVAPRNGHFLYTPMKCEGCLGNCIYPTTNNMFLCVSKIDKRVVLETVVTLLSEEKTL